MHFSFFLSFFRGKVDLLHISNKRSKGKIEGKTKSIVSRGVQKRRKDTALVAQERVVGSSSLRRERKSVFLSAQRRDF